MDLPLPAAPEVGSPFVLYDPIRQTLPLVLASAHSGRNYPPAFVAASRLDARALRRSEDCFVDELYADAPTLGAPLLAATFPRVYCDANREAWELDPEMFEGPLPPWVNSTSQRVSAGLGTIARVVASGESIYRSRLRFEDAASRVRSCWQPYHAQLAILLARTRELHGACLLIDCHSMPAPTPEPAPRRRPFSSNPPADFVLGDAHGTACAPQHVRFVEELLRARGFVVRRNDPYAGGYVTRHYGQPREGVHALQIEVARGLYMDEVSLTKRPGFDALRMTLRDLIASIAGFS